MVSTRLTWVLAVLFVILTLAAIVGVNRASQTTPAGDTIPGIAAAR